MEYKIVKYPAPILRKVIPEVKNIGEEELYLVRAMIEAMLKYGGVGLAANQIGVDKRVFVASPRMRASEVLVLFNPRIIKMRGKEIAEEGCLSLPGIAAEVKRAFTVEVTGLNMEGESVTLKAEGLLARIIQHEVDHLNGKVFLNRLPLKERRQLLKKFKSL